MTSEQYENGALIYEKIKRLEYILAEEADGPLALIETKCHFIQRLDKDLYDKIERRLSVLADEITEVTQARVKDLKKELESI